ncbi:MAG: hypothetical protein EXR72_26410 [Myxococcales bacterium]|nr:hypothetical protein [Myxococcales bacterium]
MTRMLLTSLLLLCACAGGPPDSHVVPTAATVEKAPVAAATAKAIGEPLATPRELRTEIQDVPDHGCDALHTQPLALPADWAIAARSRADVRATNCSTVNARPRRSTGTPATRSAA